MGMGKFNTAYAGSRGFTLVEILTVIAIIVFLASFLGVVILKVQRNARVQAARAQVQRIGIGLNLYNGQFRNYPPDTGFGLEADRGNISGAGLVGGTRMYDPGSIWRYIGQPVTDMSKAARPVYGPFDTFKDKELKPYTGDPEFPGKNYYVVDPWNKPIGYIGAPERLLHNRDGVDIFSCGPDGKTAWDINTSSGSNPLLDGCDDGQNNGYAGPMSSNRAYNGSDDDGDGVLDNGPELGEATLNGTLTKNKRNPSATEVLDDINNWDGTN
jgi:prepilin-type N-terminal cleavage/methylation domain-containing protein